MISADNTFSSTGFFNKAVERITSFLHLFFRCFEEVFLKIFYKCKIYCLKSLFIKIEILFFFQKYLFLCFGFPKWISVV